MNDLLKIFIHLPVPVTGNPDDHGLFFSSSFDADKRMHKALTTNTKPSNGGDDDEWETDADFEVPSSGFH